MYTDENVVRRTKQAHKQHRFYSRNKMKGKDFSTK